MAEEPQETCWICLESGGNDLEADLVQPCKCPRRVHKRCLARWQLHSAGKSEEKACRFCHERLPDWKTAIRPQGLEPVQPVMSVHYGGQVYQLRVHPGPEGLQQFQAALHQLLGISPSDHSIDVTFECKVPGNRGKIELQGMTAFDAAVYCASLTAAERRQAKEAKGAATAGSRSLHQSSRSTSVNPPALSTSRSMVYTRSSSTLASEPSQALPIPAAPQLTRSTTSVRRSGWFNGGPTHLGGRSSTSYDIVMCPREPSPPTTAPTTSMPPAHSSLGMDNFLVARIPKFLRKLGWPRSTPTAS